MREREMGLYKRGDSKGDVAQCSDGVRITQVLIQPPPPPQKPYLPSPPSHSPLTQSYSIYSILWKTCQLMSDKTPQPSLEKSIRVNPEKEICVSLLQNIAPSFKFDPCHFFSGVEVWTHFAYSITILDCIVLDTRYKYLDTSPRIDEIGALGSPDSVRSSLISNFAFRNSSNAIHEDRVWHR